MRFLPILLLLAATPLAAQHSADALPAALRPALAQIERTNGWTLEQQRTICEIPAPPFKEAARAAEYRARLLALGFANTRLDSIGNVIAELTGSGNGPVVVLSAHLDTVFPDGTDVTVKTEGTRMMAPGIGDDCRGLAVLLAVARSIREQRVTLPGTLIFAATVGEEGLGNSRGARYLLGTELKGRNVSAFVTVDLDDFAIVNTHVGSHRYRVTFRGPGGHSYGDFGMPNPLHALGRAIAALSDLQVPADPKTTFNVGVVEGGRSVNSISDAGSFLLDMRSSSAAALDALDGRAMQAIRAAVDAERARWPASTAALSVSIDTLGMRAAGQSPAESPIAKAAIATARAVGGSPALDAGSTDAGAALPLGIPSVAIGGGGRGTGAHALGEAYEDGSRGWAGPQWALLLSAVLLGVK